jgi:adenylate cyclase
MRSRLAAAALVALGVFAAVFLLRGAGLLQALDLLVYDQWTRFSAEAPETDSRIVLLEITEQDIRELGHWPLSDRVLAETLRKLKAVGVRAIGLDIYRDLPVPPGESALRQALEKDRRIVAVRKFGDSGTDGIPGPPVLRGTDQVGFNDILVDPDGIVRRGLLFLDNGDEAVEYSFALRVALLALAAEGVHPEADPENPEWMRLGAFTLYPLDGNDGGYAGEDDGGYQFLLDYEGAMGSLESIELSTLLRDEIEPARLRDKIVLLGVNAESLPDFLNVPFEREVGVSGVELHGHMVRQLVRQGLGESRPVRVLDDWQEAALIGALALLGCGLAFGARGLSVTVAGLAFVLALLWVAGAYAVRAGWWIPMVPPGLAWIASVGVVEVWSSGRERAQRAMLMRLFSRHVSPEIADEIWRQRGEFFRDGRPRPQRLTASVLFIDIVNYTARAEKMNPEDHMEWLNDFMETMAQQVQNHGGVVDDYFGDGMKANFGVPFSRDGKDEVARDARAAVSCALAMANALEGLNARYRERHLPSVNTRVGIATGPVLAGSLGSAERLKYTTLGDVVVTAQRLESLDAIDHDFEKLPSRILVGDQTRLHLGERFRCEPLGSFAVKGKDEPVGVHRVTEASSRTGSGVD